MQLCVYAANKYALILDQIKRIIFKVNCYIIIYVQYLAFYKYFPIVILIKFELMKSHSLKYTVNILLLLSMQYYQCTLYILRFYFKKT